MNTHHSAELFLTGPIAHIQDQKVTLYDPLKKETMERMLFNPTRSWSVLFFYPADFSYVCPTELAKLNALYDDFHKSGVEVLVISRDSIFVHKKRIEIQPELVNFKVKMVSDKDGAIGKNVGLINTTTGDYERAVFVCSPAGKVAYMQISNASVGRNIDELLRVINALNHLVRHPDTLCQENRQEGDTGIDTCEIDEHIIIH